MMATGMALHLSSFNFIPTQKIKRDPGNACADVKHKLRLGLDAVTFPRMGFLLTSVEMAAQPIYLQLR